MSELKLFTQIICLGVAFATVYLKDREGVTWHYWITFAAILLREVLLTN